MNKYLKLFGILSLLCFSFYYTEKIAQFIKSKDPIYESLKAIEEDYKTPYVNAVINEDTIIPGIYGQSINLEKSFRKMKNYGFFVEDALVFDDLKPEVSLEENKDKIIEKGNSKKGAVTFILDNEESVAYFEEIGLPYSVLTTKDTINKTRNNGTKINSDTKNYEEIEKNLKLKKENNPYCFVTSSDFSFCKSKKKLLIRESLLITKSNFLKNYNKAVSGSIIYIQNSIELSNLKVFIESVLFRGLNVISLDEMVSENNN